MNKKTRRNIIYSKKKQNNNIRKTRLYKKIGGNPNKTEGVIITYLRKLQKFNQKASKSGIKSICNFACKKDDKFKRIKFPRDTFYQCPCIPTKGRPCNPDGWSKSDDDSDNDSDDDSDDDSNRDGDRDEEGKEITDNEYFKSLYEGDEKSGTISGKNYFINQYNKNFEHKNKNKNKDLPHLPQLPYNSIHWVNIIHDLNKISKNTNNAREKYKIIFGPAELLAPFTDQGWYGLSHNLWTPNLNFNYIIHMLYLIGEIFFIIPTYNNVHTFNLSCDIHNLIGKEKNEYTSNPRATNNEMVLLSFLEDEKLVDLIFVEHKSKSELIKGYEMYLNETTTLPSFKIKPSLNKLKTNSFCRNPKTIAACGKLELKSDSNNETNNENEVSNIKYDVPYKFHIIHVVANSEFKQRFIELEKFGNIDENGKITGDIIKTFSTMDNVMQKQSKKSRGSMARFAAAARLTASAAKFFRPQK